MKKLTKKMKIKILKEALATIIGQEIRPKGFRFGLCWAIREARSYPFTKNVCPDFGLFGIKEQKITCGDYWFPLNNKGDKQRIKFLRAAIRKLQSKKVKKK